MISILEANRYSEVYRPVFQSNDLNAALEKIGTQEYFHPWFDQITPLFSSSEMIEALGALGFEVVGNYGVRCLCDYLPNEPKFEADYFNRLEQLERKLSDIYPYYLLARFYQVIVRKIEEK